MVFRARPREVARGLREGRARVARGSREATRIYALREAARGRARAARGLREAYARGPREVARGAREAARGPREASLECGLLLIAHITVCSQCAPVLNLS